MRVSQSVLEVLDRAAFDGSSLKLAGQLDRKLYTDTAKVIELAGGKWNRKAGAHLFVGDAAEAIEPIILTGEIIDRKKLLQAFYTPIHIAELVIDAADIASHMRVLEPSCGDGALVGEIPGGCATVAIDIDPQAVAAVDALNYARVETFCGDFLTLPSLPDYDRVVMNPPFTGQQDAKHVLHALRFLRPGGRLVAIMASSVTFRDTPAHRQVRDLADDITDLPEGSFKAAGTSVNTVVVTINAEVQP
jgi:predicted RNA methylase